MKFAPGVYTVYIVNGITLRHSTVVTIRQGNIQAVILKHLQCTCLLPLVHVHVSCPCRMCKDARSTLSGVVWVLPFVIKVN